MLRLRAPACRDPWNPAQTGTALREARTKGSECLHSQQGLHSPAISARPRWAIRCLASRVASFSGDRHGHRLRGPGVVHHGDDAAVRILERHGVAAAGRGHLRPRGDELREVSEDIISRRDVQRLRRGVHRQKGVLGPDAGGIDADAHCVQHHIPRAVRGDPRPDPVADEAPAFHGVGLIVGRHVRIERFRPGIVAALVLRLPNRKVVRLSVSDLAFQPSLGSYLMLWWHLLGPRTTKKLIAAFDEASLQPGVCSLEPAWVVGEARAQ